jgi:hypothetical protein
VAQCPNSSNVQSSHSLLQFSISLCLQKDELETVTKLAREQKEQIILAEEQYGSIEKPIFYSVRTNPPKTIPSLKGPTLNVSDIIDASTDTNSNENSNSVLSTAVIAEIDLIEGGIVTGWACSRNSDVLGPLKIVIYVNRVLVADAAAVEDVDLPASARVVCQSDGDQAPGAAPKGFFATFPMLPQGTHQVRTGLIVFLILCTATSLFDASFHFYFLYNVS